MGTNTRARGKRAIRDQQKELRTNRLSSSTASGPPSPLEKACRDRRPRRSVQVWRYLRSKLTALSRQGKLELTRRWRVWSATDNGFHAVTPHPFRCSQSEDILPLEKAYDVHRFSTDGTVAIIFKTALFFGLLMKATSLVAFPCEGRGTTKWWMSSIRDQRWNSAPTVGRGFTPAAL